jgi:hypothetical protein
MIAEILSGKVVEHHSSAMGHGVGWGNADVEEDWKEQTRHPRVHVVLGGGMVIKFIVYIANRKLPNNSFLIVVYYTKFQWCVTHVVLGVHKINVLCPKL